MRSLEIMREIFVVTELLDFERLVTRPHCMAIRTDLQRFVHGATQLRKPLQEPLRVKSLQVDNPLIPSILYDNMII